MPSDKSKKIEADVDPALLQKLLGEATRGPWRISTGLMADSLWITAHEREPSYGDPDKHDGPICHVSTEKHHYKSEKDAFGNRRGESRSWTTPIKKARADAELIVAAVNALPELLRRLGCDGAETAWLIEWPADRHGPTRYFSVGEPPVIDPNHATRFARKVDAETVLSRGELKGATKHGAKACEHMWLPSSKREREAA